MRRKYVEDKLTVEEAIVIKIISGYFLTMSAYVTQRMNVYIGFLILVIISAIAWFGFMIHDFENYRFFEVVNSVVINIPLFLLSVFSIACFKSKRLYYVKYPITFAALLFCMFVGMYYGIMDLIFMDTYSHTSIAFWGLITDAFRAFGGMLLFLALLDDRDRSL